MILLACMGYSYVALVLATAGGLFVGALVIAPYLNALKLAFNFGAIFGGIFFVGGARNLDSPRAAAGAARQSA